MNIGIVNGVLDIGGKLIDRLFPDETERMKAKAELQAMKEKGDLKELETRLSAILAEAESDDPWTSRARPSFLYVIYLMILSSIPMGMLHAYSPETASSIASGMQAWLSAIPDSLWTLFGAGYLGYAGARSMDKRALLRRKEQ